MDYINKYIYLKYPLKFYVDMFVYEYIKVERDKAWQLYLVQYPLMTKNNFKQFDFDDRIKKKKKSKQSEKIDKEKMIQDAEAFIHKISNKKKEGV